MNGIQDCSKNSYVEINGDEEFLVAINSACELAYKLNEMA